MKSALFIDFDNVYSGLNKLDPTVADRFARQPVVWMNWLIDALALPEHAPDGARRRLLVRRCYLNPQVYQRFRSYFNLAGFEITDCPPLTGEGKTSTDIHMVLDIVDLLAQQETRYDEFIVFSADADFTPLLRKLRRADRRTTVLAIGFPAAAYRASADLLIDQDDFVRQALGYRDEAHAPETAEVLPAEPLPAAAPPLSTEDERALADAALAYVRKTLAEAPAPVALPKLAAMIRAAIRQIDAATWAGFGSFRRLVDSWELAPLCVTWVGGGYVYDPARHAPPETPAATGASSSAGEIADITRFIQNEVAKSAEPVLCSRIINVIFARGASVAADWQRKDGEARRFLESLDLAPLAFDWRSAGGSIYDPQRHVLADVASADGEPAY